MSCFTFSVSKCLLKRQIGQFFDNKVFFFTLVSIFYTSTKGEACFHLWGSDPPSELAPVSGVELSVGLSTALVTLGFFLHSKATWSLHSLWQFIPQSARGRTSEKELSHVSEQINYFKRVGKKRVEVNKRNWRNINESVRSQNITLK